MTETATPPVTPEVSPPIVRRAEGRGAHESGEQHRDVTGGAARAAVFGVSDGLLTNVSLILGVAGAGPAAGVVRLAGVAGLLAGAFSMAAGEYISMSAQSELITRELAVERREIERHPESERRELMRLYLRRGVRRDIAEEVATALMRDPDTALEVHAREELGISPDATGRPRAAAAASFGTFAGGAFVPLAPWFVLSGMAAVVSSLVLASILALAVGWWLGTLTGRGRLRSAVRQFLIAVVVAAVTFGVGRLFGVGTGV